MRSTTKELSKYLGQRLTTTYQPDPVILSPKRNSILSLGQIIDPLSVRFPIMGGNGNESNGRNTGHNVFGDLRAGLELR